ncbi:hypothetical protein EX30DRAFT_312119 [Ascodesmis nigricans]|uniref:superoxide dismutase n=1 Tax=Ascodesmis nigricans TaxID=341454 RepID=A0A4V6RHA6_9PEZI|nr:hypothetical protein EX30DRAFT_312119 [Ascodesmis nigricans]
MQYKSVIAAALLIGASNAVTGKLGDAAPILDNPAGVSYVAHFTSGAVTGYIRAEAGANGKGVDFDVKIKSTDGKWETPLSYHLHDAPVTNGNCTTTLAHLDPYQRGQADPCDATKPETCEVGDLSGKHGKIETVPFAKQYNDLYASTKSGIGAFFGNRSVVIHANDEKKSRIACANFELVEEDDEDDEECDAGSDDDDEEEPSVSVPRPTGTGTVPSGTGAPKPSVSHGTNSTGGGNVPPQPTTSQPPGFEGAASALGMSSALALIGGAVALLAAF